jgi:hypothetical protein
MKAVLVAETGASGPSAACTCGQVNFSGHAEHAQAYLDEHPELTGRGLTHAALPACVRTPTPAARAGAVVREPRSSRSGQVPAEPTQRPRR